MRTELYIEGNRVDISEVLSNLLTFAIDDVKDFASRQTTFSKTVVLPGTGRNNAIFGNIFNLGHSNTYDPLLDNVGTNYNASKSAKCLLFQDNVQTFKGTMRLMDIVNYQGRKEYEVALNGDLTTLNVALSSAFLTDLDFSAYNLDWDEVNIVASWDNPGGSGVYFPLIDYGTYSPLKHDWDFRTCRPALYVKEYIDKMFAAAGFRYESDLFETARFESLIVPHNQKQLTKPTDSILNGQTGTSQHILDRGGAGSDDAVFGSATGALFNITSDKIFEYNGATTITVTINIHLAGYYNFAYVPPGVPYFFKITVQKNGVDYYYDGISMNTNNGVNIGYTKDYSISMTLATNDVFKVHCLLQGGPNGPAAVYITESSINVTSSTVLTAPIDYGEEIDLQYAIPQNVRQVDFLSSIVKLYNLYVYEDKFDDRLMKIAPFVDYYSTDSANAVDWTYKRNRSEPARVKPLSELNSKTYNFNYKDDSDYYNDLYKKRYNQGYGSYIFDSQYEFATAANKLELIFAATPLVGYVGEDKVYPTIFKRSGTTEETIDSVIRIMQTKKITGVANWDLLNGVTVLDTLSTYGYAGHFDDPDFPTNDLNFGVLKELFFLLESGDLTVTQFNVYWSSYMAEITHKDSKMLIAKYYLTPKDIFELDFSKYVYDEGVLYRLNKITDYNASKPSDCEVQLLKVIHTIY